MRFNRLRYILYLILIFLKCTSDYSGISDVYTVEKMFYKAEKLQQNILINPDIARDSDFQAAEDAYREIIAKYNRHWAGDENIRNYVRRSWLAVGKLHRLQKKHDAAIRVYQEMIKKSSSDQELCAIAQYAIATSMEQQGKITRAINAYQKLVKKYPPVLGDSVVVNLDILNTPNYIAQLYRRLGKNILAESQYEDARRYYRKVKRNWPDSQVSLAAEHQIAKSYAAERNWQHSVDVLKQAIQSHIKSRDVFELMLQLATIYEQHLQQPYKALYTYQRILNTYPEHPQIVNVYLAKGSHFVSRNKLEQARHEFQLVLDKFPAIQDACIKAQLAIGKCYELKNDWNKAINEYQWVMEKYPRNPKTLDIPLYIANYYQSHHEPVLAQTAYKNAIKKYQQIIDLHPKTTLALIATDYLSTCYVRTEQWKQATEELSGLIIMDIPPAKKINILVALASIYEEKLNNLQKALEYYSLLLDKYPNIPLTTSIESKTVELQQKLNIYKQQNDPPQPSEIIAVDKITRSSIRIKWRRNYDNDFNCYKLYRGTMAKVDTTSKQVAAIFSSDQTEAVDQTIVSGEQYFYRLYVFDNGGLSSASSAVRLREQRSIQLDPVTINGYCVDWSRVQLSWSTATIDNFECYKIYRSTSSQVTSSSHLVKSIYDRQIKQFTDEGLQEQTNYYYSIYVYDRNGNKQPGNTVHLVTHRNTPPRKANLEQPFITGQQTIKIRWSQNNEPDFSMYRVYRSQNPGIDVNSAPTWISSDRNSNTFIDDNVRTGKTYFYKVVILDKGGLLSESNEVAVTM